MAKRWRGEGWDGLEHVGSPKEKMPCRRQGPIRCILFSSLVSGIDKSSIHPDNATKASEQSTTFRFRKRSLEKYVPLRITKPVDKTCEEPDSSDRKTENDRNDARVYSRNEDGGCITHEVSVTTNENILISIPISASDISDSPQSGDGEDISILLGHSRDSTSSSFFPLKDDTEALVKEAMIKDNISPPTVGSTLAGGLMSKLNMLPSPEPIAMLPSDGMVDDPSLSSPTQSIPDASIGADLLRATFSKCGPSSLDKGYLESDTLSQGVTLLCEGASEAEREQTDRGYQEMFQQRLSIEERNEEDSSSLTRSGSILDAASLLASRFSPASAMQEKLTLSTCPLTPASPPPPTPAPPPFPPPTFASPPLSPPSSTPTSPPASRPPPPTSPRRHASPPTQPPLSISGTQFSPLPPVPPGPTPKIRLPSLPPVLPPLESPAAVGTTPTDSAPIGVNPFDSAPIGANPPDSSSIGANPPDSSSIGANPPDSSSIGANLPDSAPIGTNPPDSVSIDANSPDPAPPLPSGSPPMTPPPPALGPPPMTPPQPPQSGVLLGKRLTSGGSQSNGAGSASGSLTGVESAGCSSSDCAEGAGSELGGADAGSYARVGCEGEVDDEKKPADTCDDAVSRERGLEEKQQQQPYHGAYEPQSPHEGWKQDQQQQLEECEYQSEGLQQQHSHLHHCYGQKHGCQEQQQEHWYQRSELQADESQQPPQQQAQDGYSDQSYQQYEQSEAYQDWLSHQQQQQLLQDGYDDQGYHQYQQQPQQEQHQQEQQQQLPPQDGYGDQSYHQCEQNEEYQKWLTYQQQQQQQRQQQQQAQDGYGDQSCHQYEQSEAYQTWLTQQQQQQQQQDGYDDQSYYNYQQHKEYQTWLTQQHQLQPQQEQAQDSHKDQSDHRYEQSEEYQNWHQQQRQQQQQPQDGYGDQSYHHGQQSEEYQNWQTNQQEQQQQPLPQDGSGDQSYNQYEQSEENQTWLAQQHQQEQEHKHSHQRQLQQQHLQSWYGYEHTKEYKEWLVYYQQQQPYQQQQHEQQHLYKQQVQLYQQQLTSTTAADTAVSATPADVSTCAELSSAPTVTTWYLVVDTNVFLNAVEVAALYRVIVWGRGHTYMSVPPLAPLPGFAPLSAAPASAPGSVPPSAAAAVVAAAMFAASLTASASSSVSAATAAVAAALQAARSSGSSSSWAGLFRIGADTFPSNERVVVVLPQAVVRELDGLKENKEGAHGRYARRAFRLLRGALAGSEAWLRVQAGHEKAEVTSAGNSSGCGGQRLSADDSVLSCCLYYHQSVAPGATVLLTGDIALQVKAFMEGLSMVLKASEFVAARVAPGSTVAS